MTASAVRQWMRRLSGRAGLGRALHPHMMRHSTGSQLAGAGAAIDVVQELLGHRSIISTQVYVHPSRVHAKSRGSGRNRRREAPGGEEEGTTMRAARAEVAVVPEPASPEARLRSLVDWDLLAHLGYDASAQVFAPDRDDPVFGFTVCRAAGCEQAATRSLGLCWRCGQHWEQAGPGVDFASFCHDAPGPHPSTSDRCPLRRVPHPRP